MIEWPQSREAEQGLLGCAILDGTRAGELDDSLFHDLKHKAIAALLRDMASDGAPIDVSTVGQRVLVSGQQKELGGLSYISELPDKTGSAAQWDYWCEILRPLAILRAVISAGWEAVVEAQKGNDANDVAEAFERAALSVRGGLTAKDEVNLKEALRQITDDMESAVNNQNTLRGLASGFFDLDKKLGGFRPQQLIILAARPSVGKTSLAMNIVERVAVLDRIPVGVFSLEMSGKELIHRMCCSMARVDSVASQEGRITFGDIDKIQRAQGRILSAPLHICDRAGLSIGEMSAIARRYKKQYGIRMLVIDYLSLLNTGDKRRGLYEDVSFISGALKRVAKELDLPAIVLAQLNRDVEKNDRKPRLSDLRDSGSIEQDADVVCFIHRSGEASDEIQPVELIVAKHRNGPTGKVDLQFHRNYTRFESCIG